MPVLSDQSYYNINSLWSDHRQDGYPSSFHLRDPNLDRSIWHQGDKPNNGWTTLLPSIATKMVDIFCVMCDVMCGCHVLALMSH